jgi:hypothetical protein
MAAYQRLVALARVFLSRLGLVVLAAGVAVLASVAVAVPAHADTYTGYLVGQLQHDPAYISGFSPMASPADAPVIRRLLARIPLKTYVVADVAAGPDGRMQDSDLAAVLHDQLGGGLFILARTDGSASATGFGTSLPVGDAMTAAVTEYGTQPKVTLVQLVQRFVTIVLSGKTEQRLAADQQAQQERLNPGQVPAWEVTGAAAAGAAVSGTLTAILLIHRKRRRLARTGKVLT